MVGRDEAEQVTSPYSTGGGGTVLEHRFGAVLLAHLLLSDPVSALGDDATPVAVRFQDSGFSPVDDLIVVGDTADGAQRRLWIGVRRAPRFTTSDDSTADLLVSYVRVVTDHWDQVRAGRWRLALAVVSPNPAVQQVRELAVIAQGHPSDESFRAAVKQAGRTNEAVRTRLFYLDALIAQAASSQKVTTAEPASELTWRVLHVLRLWGLRLEGVDESDRTAVAGRLRNVVPSFSVAGADALFEVLERLSRRFAPAGASVTESMLRRQLSGTPIDRNPSYTAAWHVLDTLSTAETRVQQPGHHGGHCVPHVSPARLTCLIPTTSGDRSAACEPSSNRLQRIMVSGGRMCRGRRRSRLVAPGKFLAGHGLSCRPTDKQGCAP
ncbi:hypothetical protein ACFXBB_06145 [Streptomyces scopuliridis]|uniref:hypothetical protein n=1 Tax=Streptomyces scopuliridis TaxID=452529 RepID=UPI0036B09537